MKFDEGKYSEQLIDIQSDPGEMRNAAHDPENTNVLSQHRTLFNETFTG